MKKKLILTATTATWNQWDITVYRDADGEAWIAYTHDIREGKRFGCYCRLILSNIADKYCISVKNDENPQDYRPFGDPDTEVIVPDGIPLKDCTDYLLLRSVGAIREADDVF